MTRRIGMIHFAAQLVQVFNELTPRLLPDVEVIHLVDEGMLKDLLRLGKLTSRMERRLRLLVSFAEESGAEAVMVTGSSFAPLVKKIESKVNVPVLRVDEAMADEAVRFGKRIGILGTSSTTMKPTTSLIEERAVLRGKKVTIEPLLCEGAFEAMRRGDLATHDRIVTRSLTELVGRVDVVVLAQASMNRVLANRAETTGKTPVLSSPPLALKRLAEVLKNISP